MFHVYILRCADGSFYVGSCKDLDERVATHNRGPSTRFARSGQGATWTAERRPVELVHSESFPTRTAAVAREKQLKRWSRAKKAALASGDTERLRALARRREDGPLLGVPGRAVPDAPG